MKYYYIIEKEKATCEECPFLYFSDRKYCSVQHTEFDAFEDALVACPLVESLIGKEDEDETISIG